MPHPQRNCNIFPISSTFSPFVSQFLFLALSLHLTLSVACNSNHIWGVDLKFQKVRTQERMQVCCNTYCGGFKQVLWSGKLDQCTSLGNLEANNNTWLCPPEGNDSLAETCSTIHHFTVSISPECRRFTHRGIKDFLFMLKYLFLYYNRNAVTYT